MDIGRLDRKIDRLEAKADSILLIVSQEDKGAAVEDVKMMRMVFVAPLQGDANIQNWGAPSLGLMRIVAYLKANLEGRDIECFIYDQQVDDYNPFERWRGKKVDFLGISVLHYTIVETFAFAHRWRGLHPETFIFVGGNEASANYQDILDKCPADAAVLAEGEDVTLDLVRWKLGEKRLEEIPGIVYRKHAEAITEERFWEYWRHVDFSDYQYPEFWDRTALLFDDPAPRMDEIRCVRLTPSSHCQRKCTFCSLSFVRNICCNGSVPPVSLRGWQIMELVHRIKRQLPETRTIYFCNDDIFYPNRKYFEEFAELYEKSGYDYRILVQTSSYCLREGDFPLLRRIGCEQISVGVESASERIQRSLGKPQDMDKIERIIDWSLKHRVPVYYLVILIPPESTMEDLWINYRTISRWIDRGIGGVSIMPVVYAYRGMPLYEDNRYRILYRSRQIPGMRATYNDPHYVLPNDPKVRELTIEFIEREWDYVNAQYENLDSRLKFKGGTSRFLLQLLGELLRKYDKTNCF